MMASINHFHRYVCWRVCASKDRIKMSSQRGRDGESLNERANVRCWWPIVSFSLPLLLLLLSSLVCCTSVLDAHCTHCWLCWSLRGKRRKRPWPWALKMVSMYPSALATGSDAQCKLHVTCFIGILVGQTDFCSARLFLSAFELSKCIWNVEIWAYTSL